MRKRGEIVTVAGGKSPSGLASLGHLPLQGRLFLRAKPAQKGAPMGELAEFTRPEGLCSFAFIANLPPECSTWNIPGVLFVFDPFFISNHCAIIDISGLCR